jgi:hypothetical protein
MNQSTMKSWWRPSRLIEGALALRHRGWSWVLRFLGKTLRRLSKPISRRRVHLGVEEVEARILMSTTTWLGTAGDHLWTTDDNWSGGAVPGASDTVIINDASAAVILNTSAQISNLNLYAGTLTDSGTLSLTGTASTWTGGTMAGSGTLTLASGAALDIAGNVILDEQVFRNDGTITWSGGNITLQNNADLVNDNIVDVRSSAQLLEGSGTTNRIENYGLFKKTLTTGTTNIQVDFDNWYGTVDEQLGSLLFSAGTLTIDGGTVKNAEFGGATVNVDNGGVSLPEMPVTLAA